MQLFPKIINFEHLQLQTFNDKNFIGEIFNDFFDEIEESKREIQPALDNKNNLEIIYKAIHRLKGSASYLGCEQLRAHLVEIDEYIGDKRTQCDGSDGREAFIMQHISNLCYIVFLVDVPGIRAELARGLVDDSIWT